MPKKQNRNKCIHTHWGRPYDRIEAERTPGKVRNALGEKLLARGQPALLYLPVTSATPGVVACTCQKDTNNVNDRTCHECYGFGLVPGFELFMYETVHFGTSEASSFTLTGCAVDTRIKPNRILLDTGVTSGTVETQDKAYSNPSSDDWAVNTDVFLRDTGNTATVEFSTDSGGSWFDVSVINGAEKPVGAGTIRFRITLGRAAAGDKTPAFEIVRARHVNSSNYSREVLDQRSDLSPGQILVLRPWVVEQAQTDTGRGVDINWIGDRSWTMPLDFFDTSLTINTPETRVDDGQPGPHPFYEYARGIKTGERLPITNIKWNEEFGVFTHQSFDDRRGEDFEDPYSIVF